MQRIINREIEKTIDMKRLGQIVPPYCVVRRYDNIRGKTLKEVMGKHTVLILLWNIHSKQHRVLDKPGHFFVISTRNAPAEPCVVFSSTGMTPKKELFITQSDPELLNRILPKGTIYNNKKLQISNNSQTCWRFAILYAHLCTMGLKKFQSLFTHPSVHLSTPDQLATALTLMSLY
jgi:hypothetical protein